MNKKILRKKIKDNPCKFKGSCWRFIYTCVCFFTKYQQSKAPDRFSLMCEGYLEEFDNNIFPIGGIFCKNLPYYNGHAIINACPGPGEKCQEYTWQQEREARKGKKRKPYTNSNGS